MQQKITELESLTLVGLMERTNNNNEMNPATSKIGPLMNYYLSHKIAEHIKNRVSPGVTYALYTNYENDENGDYSYFIGEIVSSLDNQDLTRFKTLNIAKSHYQKFTTHAGKMPDIVISAWQTIWKMDKHKLGGKRSYLADFEVYDQRAIDPSNSIVDIYIGIHQQ